MWAFILKRIASLAVVLFFAVTATFFLIRVAPGGPFDREKEPPAHIKEEILKKYDLDGSLWSQYTRYLGDLARGDLRVSFKYRNRSVNEILAQALPVTFVLGSTAFLLATFGGIFLGTLAAVRKNTLTDYSAMFVALLAISLPSFITGPLLIYFFALKIPLFPVGGWQSWMHLVLPSIALAAPYAAYIARLMRNSLLDVLSQDFIRTAYAKGLKTSSVVTRHALKVAILPVISFLGPLAAHLLTGSIIVETIFSIPGAGRYFVLSIENRDGFLLSGAVIVYCTLLVTFNFIVDLTYSFLDKRIALYD